MSEWRRRASRLIAEIMGHPDKPGDDDLEGDDGVTNLSLIDIPARALRARRTSAGEPRSKLRCFQVDNVVNPTHKPRPPPKTGNRSREPAWL